MKVLLIEPSPLKKGLYYTRSKGTFGHAKSSFVRPPIDLMVIAGYLRKLGHSVAIEDANVHQHDIAAVRERIGKEQPDMVVVNTSTPTIVNDLKVCGEAKSVVPGVITAAIGVHVMALPEEALETEPGLDLAVTGEPELPIAEFIEAGGRADNVKGLAWRDGEKIKVNEDVEKVKDLDLFGIPAHDLVPLHLYHDPAMRRSPMTTTLMSRGCKYACSFCSMNFYSSFRLRSVESVCEELDWLVNDLGVREIKFYDSLFSGNHEWVQKFCERLITKGPKLSWYCSVRADELNADIVKLMRRAGCHTMHMGIESASQEILKNVNKKLDPSEVEMGVKWTHNAGIRVLGHFIFGMPGETKQTVRETIDFAKRLKIDIASFNMGVPHPGTPFHDYLMENGLVHETLWENYDPGNTDAVYELPTISNAELSELTKQAYREFYFRPSKIFSMFVDSAGDPLILKNYYNNARAIIRNYLTQ